MAAAAETREIFLAIPSAFLASVSASKVPEVKINGGVFVVKKCILLCDIGVELVLLLIHFLLVF